MDRGATSGPQLVDESSKRYMFTDAAASTAAREGAAPGSRGEDTLHRDGDQSDWQDQQQEQEQQQEEHRGEPGPRWEGLDEERRQQEREEQNAQLARDRLEQQERDVRLDALRNLSPEEYLDQTGVSVVMQEALGLLAELRPCTPLQTFSDIIRDYARNTHPALRKAKLLRYACPSATGSGLSPCWITHDAGSSRSHTIAKDKLAESDWTNVNEADTHEYGAGGACPILEQGTGLKGARTAVPAEPFAQKQYNNGPNVVQRNPSQLEVMCEPLHRFLCGGTRVCGNEIVSFAGNETRGVSGSGRPGTMKACGIRGAGRSRGERGLAQAGIAPRKLMAGGTEAGGVKAPWREVRRFLEALLTGAGVDAECRAAAMAALEREGSISSSATGAITDGGEGAGGDGAAAVVRQRIHTSGVNFSRFVAAVRAVLLFEGFDQEARKAFVSLTQSADGAASLDDLLAHLYPPHQFSGSSGAHGGGRTVREAVRERLDVGRRGETKVRLSTLTDCVVSSRFHAG